MSLANNGFHVTGKGNLNLGFEGDDGAGDATHGFAKNDLWVSVSPVTLPSGIPTTTLTEANVRTAVGQYARSYTAGGAITPSIPIPIAQYLPFSRQFTGSPAAVVPKGFKLTGMYLSYTVATANATSVAVVFTQETAQSNNSARANTSTTPLGAVTYQNPIGTTVASLPVAIQANPYVNFISVATPAFVNTLRSNLTAEIQLSLPLNCVLTITEIALVFSLALY